MSLQQDDTAPTRDARDCGFYYSGWAGGILPLTIKNAVLNILTFTLYRFWAKTEVRRHLWRHTKFLGDPLEYGGFGKELFLGFLLILFVVILPLAIVNETLTQMLGPGSGLELVLLMVVLFLLGVAQYRARRYRLSRTVWRGIRAAQTGASWVYGLKRLAFTLGLFASAGLTYPWQRIHLNRFEMTNTWFGDRSFSFEGSAGPLYRRFAVAWLTSLFIIVAIYFLVAPSIEQFLTSFLAIQDDIDPFYSAIILTLLTGYVAIIIFFLVAPLMIVWYRVGEYAYFARCTQYEDLNFAFEVTSWKLLKLIFGNYLLTILTLGFGLPIVQMRKFRFFCDHIAVHGSTDFDAIRQSTEERDQLGEGLADAFDIGDF